MENNKENKSKFFAQYWMQPVFRQSYYTADESNDEVQAYCLNSEKGFLVLKRLLSIADEDAIEVAKIIETDERLSGWWTTDNGKRWSFQIVNGVAVPNSLAAIDYLRSKGYAIPYIGLSVEQLIEYGWIKLTEEV